MLFKKKRSAGKKSGEVTNEKLNPNDFPGSAPTEESNFEKKHAKPSRTEARKAEKAAKKAEKRALKASPEGAAARTKLKLGLLIVLLIIVLVLFGISFAAYRVSTSDRNLPNIYVGDIFVGGMTKEETLAALEEGGLEEEGSYALRVKLPAKVSFKLDKVKAGAVFSLDYAALCAYHYGHNDNWYANLIRYVKNYMVPVDVKELYRELDQDYIESKIAEGLSKFETATSDKKYVVDREKEELRFMKGGGQMLISEEVLYQEIRSALLAGENLVEHLRIDNKLEMPDFEAIYSTLAVEPQDASYDEKFNVIEEVVGCTFDTELAAELWTAAEPAEYITIPLIITRPEITKADLEARLYRDRLGSQTTLYTYSNGNRISNISLAAEKLNGLILYPGEVFSFNTAIGQRTREAGFLEAGAYADGQVVQEVGGGICQVSSTLYCASMYAQMETVSRTNHYFRIDYLPMSYDAAVSWPNPDFKFKNTREYPIKIVAYTNRDNFSLTIEIWGTDVDGSYVELSYWNSDVFDEEFTEVKIAEAAICYRYVYDANGTRIATVQEPYSLYHLHEEDIEWPEEEDSDDWIADILPEGEEVWSESGWSEENWSEDMYDSAGSSAVIIVPQ